MSELVENLSKVIDPARIVTAPERLDELAWDALSEGRIHPRRHPGLAMPVCAVTPASTEEVRRLVDFANAANVPVVPFGGGSGLMGGALSIRAGIVLDLRELNAVLEIDEVSRSARVQAGIILETLEGKLNESGFILGHDPWTVPVATVGGAISTNSVGYRAGIYGSMGEQVLGLEVVLPNGKILRTRGVEKSSAGIDLNALFIGGEGCFGIITEATIRIFPAPEKRVIHALLFATFEEGYQAVQNLFMRRLSPAIVDLGDDYAKFPAGAILCLAFEGSEEVVTAEERLGLKICRACGAAQLPPEVADDFWRNRHVIARRFAQNRRQRRNRGRDGILRDWVHVALPASKVLPFRSAALKLVDRFGVGVQESGLWIQPELFSMRLGIVANVHNQARQNLEDAVEALLRLAQQMGGSMEYTHGVGVKLAPLMEDEHGYGLELMRQIKKALDPNSILNPGKMGL